METVLKGRGEWCGRGQGVDCGRSSPCGISPEGSSDFLQTDSLSMYRIGPDEV